MTNRSGELGTSPLERQFSATRELCGYYGLRFSVEWSEAENLYYAEARGAGKGERFEVKRVGTPHTALKYLREAIRDKYGNRA